MNARRWSALLALPLLAGMLPPRRAEVTPRRAVFLYVPNGTHMDDRRPDGEGPDLDLPWTMEPLSDLRSEILVLSGLTHDKARANGDGPGGQP